MDPPPSRQRFDVPEIAQLYDGTKSAETMSSVKEHLSKLDPTKSTDYYKEHSDNPSIEGESVSSIGENNVTSLHVVEPTVSQVTRATSAENDAESFIISSNEPPSRQSHDSSLSKRNNRNTRSSVTFSTVEIREHGYTLGSYDTSITAPSAAAPPIELDWEAQHIEKHSIDNYESVRGPHREVYRTSNEERIHLLHEAGFGSQEFEAEKEKAEEAQSLIILETERRIEENSIILFEDLQGRLQEDSRRKQERKSRKNVFSCLFRRRSKTKRDTSLIG